MVRVKHRYLVAQILYPESTSAVEASSKPPSPLTFRHPTPTAITSSYLIRAIRDKIHEIFGDYGAGSCAGSITLKYFSGTTSTLILRCPRERSRLVWTALTLITHLPAVMEGRYHAGVPGVPCVFRVVHHSGTIRKCELKIIEMARKEILLAKAAGQGLADDLVLAYSKGRDGRKGVAAVMTDVADKPSGEDDWDDDSQMSDLE